jgi:hypothetical protein
MKLLALYRPDSEYSRAVEAFIRDFRYQHGGLSNRLEVLDVDSREGVAMASLYDIMEHPALMVVGDDGSLVREWTGPSLPLMSEVAGYFYNGI